MDIISKVKKEGKELFKSIYSFMKDDDIKEALNDVDPTKPFTIIYACVKIYEKYKDSTLSAEDKARLELTNICTSTAIDIINLLDIKDIKHALDEELKLIDPLAKEYEWNNYIPSNPIVNEFRDKLIGILANYGYDKGYIRILFDNLLIKQVSTNPTIISLKVKDEAAKLLKYLYHVASLFNKENPIDNIPLSKYYIEPSLIKNNKEWNVEDLLNEEETYWYEIIASDFGLGKSSYSYYIANKLAKDYLDNKGEYIPIVVELNISNPSNKFANVYGQLPLKDVIEMIKNNKLLIIFDGLDEYGNAKELYDNINNIKEGINNKANIKVLITTRVVEDYIKEFYINVDDCVKIEPFSKEQVDEFFNKYGVNLNYDYLTDIGLQEDEICKPLFAWMLAYMHREGDGLKKIDVNKLNGLDDASKHRILTTVFYHNFINAVVRGKYHKRGDKWLKYYNEEKEMLRVLAAIYNIYGKIEVKSDDELKSEVSHFLDDKLKEELNRTIEGDNKTVFDNTLKLLLESYLRVDKVNQAQRIKTYNFIHKSIQEYLLAEYLYKNIKDKKIYLLNVGEASEECIDFLHGIIDILNHYDKVKDMLDYPQDRERLIDEKDKDTIINNCKEIVKDDRIIIVDYEKKGKFAISKDNKANRYSNLYLHKWIAVSILSWLSKDNDRKINEDIKKDVEELINNTSYNVVEYYKDLALADLSEANLSRANLFGADLSEANLSGADLYEANLYEAILSRANLSEANLSGADLSEANLSEADLSGAILSRADLSGADLSRANLYEADLSGADLSRANLSEAILSGADLSRANLYEAILSRANLSEANLSGADLYEADLSGATITNILSYLFSWDDDNTIKENFSKLIYVGNVTSLNKSDNEIVLKSDIEREIRIIKEEDNTKATIIIKEEKYVIPLDIIEEDNKTKLFLPINVDDNTKAVGVILTNSNDPKDIKRALSNIHPKLRRIILRDNPNYKEIWDNK